MDRITESCKVNGENYIIITLYCSISNSYNIVIRNNHTVYTYIHFDSRPPEMLSMIKLQNVQHCDCS